MKTTSAIGSMLHGMRGLIASGLAVGLSLAMTAGAAEIYVSTNGTQTANYETWAKAFTNLQEALNYASLNDTIHVAGQTFRLTNQIDWTTSNITIRGGYEADPGGVSPGNHNPELWPTVLARSGAFNLRIMFINGADDSRLEYVTITGGNVPHGCGVRVANTQNLVLSGCVIENNVWSASVDPAQRGFGMYSAGSSVTLTNCLVRGNTGYNTYYYAAWKTENVEGGGIWSSGSLTIRDSRIVNNKVISGLNENSRARGGGIYFAGTDLVMTNVLVAGNFSSDYAGGIQVAAGTALLQLVTIAENAAEGIQRDGSANVTLTNSLVYGNWKDVAGTMDLGNSLAGVDPRFEYGYYLADGSPAIGASPDTASSLGMAAYARNLAGDAYGPAAKINLGWHPLPGTVFDLTYADIYVAPDGNDSANSGLGGGDAFRTLKQALSVARDGSRIHIAPGTYKAADGEFPLSLFGAVGIEILGLGADPSQTVFDRVNNGRVMALESAHRTKIQNLTLTRGNTSGGGGLRVLYSQQVELNHVIIKDNAWSGTTTADSDGMGLYVVGSSVAVSNGIFQGNVGNNTANSTSWQSRRTTGAIFSDSVLSLRDSIVSNNIASGGAHADNRGEGGGIYVQVPGGTQNILARLSLKNVLIAGNDASNTGDGIRINSGVADFVNVTLADNQGEGLRRAGGTVNLLNCILWNNVLDTVGTIATVSNSNVGTGGYGPEPDGDGNISADPLFVDPGDGDYRLQRGSPSVDRGLNQEWMIGATDLAGVRRIFQGRVDMGCYETVPPKGTLLMVE